MKLERVLMPPLNAVECLDVLIRRAVLFVGIQVRVVNAIPRQATVSEVLLDSDANADV